MRLDKWTLGLAAVGLVSLPAMARAEEKPSPLMTAVSSTTISGYVNTSAHWTPGYGNVNVPGYAFNNSSKQDGFNLNVVKLALEKPLDESEWAAGYKAEVLFGNDANQLATASAPFGVAGSDFAIKQAYVALRAPVGNDLDFKVGVFDTIVGYEVFDSGSNPNYTRSWGYTMEPTTHTGVLATYRFAEWLNAAVGIANTYGPVINQRASYLTATPFGLNTDQSESYKTYMGSLALTAPKSWGFLGGSTAYGGIINGFDGTAAGTLTDTTRTHFYGGVTLNTPITKWKVGGAYDYAMFGDSGWPTQPFTSFAWAASIYSSFQLTEKLTLHGRGEYATQSDLVPVFSMPTKVLSVTGTLQYDLWRNVVSRVEVRWDHAADGTPAFGGTNEGGGAPTLRNSLLFAANVIYNF